MKRLAHLWMRMTGWSFVGELPPVEKYVVLGAPHTSNWDFVAFLGVAQHFRIPARFIGKHSLFRPPFGRLMRRLGGIPVRRDSGQGLVEQVAAEIASTPGIGLVIAPEGTRGRGSGWRSGFYWIAQAAEVPIVCGFVDYATRTAGVLGTITPSGDLEGDLARLAAIYRGKVGRHPERQSEVRLREETG
jgi:1-acyl-sn-glycerol-3-phosphate acyltransferase